jgi:hypothetical protein
MSGRVLRRLLLVYAIALFAICVGVRTYFAHSKPTKKVIVESWWQTGKRVGRVVREPGVDTSKGEQPSPFSYIGQEEIVGESPLYLHPLFFTMGLVPGRDGVKATIGDKTVYATVDDLMGVQAYDRAHLWVEASFGWGTHLPSTLQVLSDQLNGMPVAEIAKKATFRRVRFERLEFKAPTGIFAIERPLAPRPRMTAETLTKELALDGIADAAIHLSGLIDGQGFFRYMVDAPTNNTIPGYNWPRHAGATFFLAQAAAVLDNAGIRAAGLRAATRLRDEMMRACGDKQKCIAPDEPTAEIGSTALALIAFTEIARTTKDTSFNAAIADLASFLRSQQREDGELMHLYDRANKKPIDVQFLYFTGEAALALARAHTVTKNEEDLTAAKRALHRLSGAGWSFFGSRYYFSEEHWTCQAVAELWERAPDREALAFCARWHEYQRRLQLDADETPFDAEGSFGFGPLVSPRVTPASSRGEAAGALAHVLFRERNAGRLPADDKELALVDTELRRALAFVLRSQFHPGPRYLFADPVAVRGGVPGSPVDWQLRIDYAQHAGSMMVRFLEVDSLKANR